MQFKLFIDPLGRSSHPPSPPSITFPFMAKSTSANASLLPLLFFAILLASFTISESRILRGLQAVTRINTIASKHILRDLGLDPFVLQNHQKRSLCANSERVAPGGPDPQHHSLPPF
ncbi:hypothetical protein Vadar_008655 [Vaccinium darrowii]|uniref:Uncharacterized protein n=1 Tax=Vaccinium darrowii TaxID=229202 RepID=A0ACB7XPC8_9ERIC|nr:hypothetical protein Vadar_008655 [Vaccinium darrowii]